MYKKIMVAIDGSDTSRHALEAALALARSNQATLEPVFVVDVPIISYEVPTYDAGVTRDALLQEGHQITDAAAKAMREANVTGVPRLVETSGLEDVAQGIVTAARECGADLLVLGTHGRRGFRRLVLGSVAERAVRNAALPVLLIPNAAHQHDQDDRHV